MIFYYNVGTIKISRLFSDTTIYHRNDLPEFCLLAPTINFATATYFLRDDHNCYVDLCAIYASHATSLNDTTALHNVKLQYVPKLFI